MSYRQCNRCVMDTTDPDIVFDENGFCNHCNDFHERLAHKVYRGEDSDRDLATLVEKIKKSGKGNKYDCLIGISGGIDSCYAAYVAKKQGLRPLALHMDNGWNSEEASRNIKNVVTKLGIDYQSYVLNYEEFKDLQLSFLRASVPELETPTDIAIPATLHKVAAKLGIKYIISGGNYVTEGILPKKWHYDAKDVKYLKNIHNRFGSRKLKYFPTFGYKKEFWYKFFRGIRIVYILNYVPYAKKDAMGLLQNELGWKYYGGKHYESRYTSFIQSYILPVKFNIDYRLATYSTQICAGEITREEALKGLKSKPYDIGKVANEKSYLCKKLGISLDEFETIMKNSPRSFKDYPNDQKFLEFIYNTYRRLMN